MMSNSNPLSSSKPTFQIKPIQDGDRSWLKQRFSESWGEASVVSRGQVHQADLLPGFVARLQGQKEPAGVAVYHIQESQCELVVLETWVQGIGIGSALIEAVRQVAEAAGCTRLWLITTNDNTHAIKFYQRRGLRLAALHRNALEVSRRLKPSIPLTGFDGIPLRDELEFKLALQPATPIPLEAPDFPRRLGRRTIYESDWVRLYLDRVHFPDGRIIEAFHLLESPKEAVAVLVQNEAGELLFEQVYRYATGRLEWEIPAGAIEPGEEILAAAQREVCEETGYRTQETRLLYTYNPANGNQKKTFHITACQVGERVAGIDPGEIRAIRWMERPEIEAMIHSGTFQDGFSLCALLLWWWLGN